MFVSRNLQLVPVPKFGGFKSRGFVENPFYSYITCLAPIYWKSLASTFAAIRFEPDKNYPYANLEFSFLFLN